MNPTSDRTWFPPAIERFVACVEAGTILKMTEFAGVVSVTNSNLMRDAGHCRYDSGAMSDDGKQVVLLFHCKNNLMEQGIGAFLALEGETVSGMQLTSNEIQSGMPN